MFSLSLSLFLSFFLSFFYLLTHYRRQLVNNVRRNTAQQLYGICSPLWLVATTKTVYIFPINNTGHVTVTFVAKAVRLKP